MYRYNDGPVPTTYPGPTGLSVPRCRYSQPSHKWKRHGGKDWRHSRFSSSMFDDVQVDVDGKLVQENFVDGDKTQSGLGDEG